MSYQFCYVLLCPAELRYGTLSLVALGRAICFVVFGSGENSDAKLRSVRLSYVFGSGLESYAAMWLALLR